jgi:hypothetical protein
MANFLNLKAVLGLNASGFRIGLKEAEVQSKNFAANMKRAFVQAFGTAAVLAWTSKIVEGVDNLTDLSEQLGVSTDALQEWGYAAKKNGKDIESVARFFEHLGEARKDALAGNQDLIQSFAQLGVSLEDLRTKRVEDLGKLIGTSIQKGDIQNLIGSLVDVGGKSASGLVATFKAGIAEMTQAAHDAGQVVSRESLANVKQLKDQIQEIQDQLRGPTIQALAQVNGWIPVIKTGIDVLWNDLLNGAGINFKGARENVQALLQKEAIGQISDALGTSKNQDIKNPQYKGDFSAGIIDKLHEFAPVAALTKKGPAIPDRPEHLTAWQQAGADVRQPVSVAPREQSVGDRLREISDYSKETARNTWDILHNPNNGRPVTMGNFGDNMF